MLWADIGDDTPSGAVLGDALDALEFGVCPAHFVAPLVEVESIGYAEIVANDHFAMRAVRVGAFDARPLALPIRPEDITF